MPAADRSLTPKLIPIWPAPSKPLADQDIADVFTTNLNGREKAFAGPVHIKGLDCPHVAVKKLLQPVGSRHKATQAVEAMLQGQQQQITQAAIDKALEGDPTALRLCLERIAPTRKDAPVSFDLPEIETMQDAAIAAKAIIKAIAQGDLTPLEAASIMSVVDQFRRTMETTELETRLAALEAKT